MNKSIKNIIIVTFSNVIVLISSLFVGFGLPFLMNQTNYGIYKIFTLYLGYGGFLHFGFIDGIYLKFSGNEYSNLIKDDFKYYSRHLITLQVVITIIIIVSSFVFLDDYYLIIGVLLSLMYPLSNLNVYFQYISQATQRFKELTIRNSIKAVLTTLSIVSIFLLKINGYIENVSYVTYIILTIIILILLTFWYMHTYRDILIGKVKKKHNRTEIISFYRTGLPLLLSNLLSNLLLSIDRQFVSILFSTIQYAEYAFAYNIISFITTIISSISVVLFPMLKNINKEDLSKKYDKLIFYISSLAFICLCFYPILNMFISTYLPNYQNSIEIFFILLPAVAITSTITIVIHNYYKLLDMNKVYFKIVLIVLLLSISLNIYAYISFGSTTAISIVSVISIFIWYFLAEYYLKKNIEIKVSINRFFIFLTIIVFFTVYTMFNMLVATIIYILYISITFIIRVKRIGFN